MVGHSWFCLVDQLFPLWDFLIPPSAVGFHEELVTLEYLEGLVEYSDEGEKICPSMQPPM